MLIKHTAHSYSNPTVDMSCTRAHTFPQTFPSHKQEAEAWNLLSSIAIGDSICFPVFVVPTFKCDPDANLKWLRCLMCVCVCVWIRHDRPEDTSAQVRRGQDGERERDSASALQRFSHRGGNREFRVQIPGQLLLAKMSSVSTHLHPFVFHQPSEFEDKAIRKVDDLLESYMGIRDLELGEMTFGL